MECFVKTEGKDVTLLLSWNHHHLYTVLDVVPPGLCTLSDRHTCSMYMYMRSKAALSVHNNTEPLKIFQRINILCSLLIVVSFIIFYKHVTTMCRSCILRSVQRECIDLDATDRNVFDRYIYLSSS